MKSIKIFTSDLDKVIDSYVAMGQTNYKVALDKLYPLINRFEAQRKIQDRKFYKRLQRDIIDGCIMPPITIAFIDEGGQDLSDKSKFERFVNENLSHGYILDGMQRLNTLKSASNDEGFESNRVCYVNIIVAENQDKLLYRMITLNNGQKPMTPRHQIEILTAEMFDFTKLINISVQTEKERAKKTIRGAFNLGDISKGYLAFLTNNVNNENNKIIDEKMDEILVSRVLDSRESKHNLMFQDALILIDSLCTSSAARSWFKINNNLIGFCVGIKDSFEFINEMSPEEFASNLSQFEIAFDSINPSKVNLGKFRRQLSKDYIVNYSELSSLGEEDLTEYFADLTS